MKVKFMLVDQRKKILWVISAIMTNEGIEWGPGMRMERDGEDECSPVRQQPADLGKNGLIIGDMFNDIEETNKIEASFWK